MKHLFAIVLTLAAALPVNAAKRLYAIQDDSGHWGWIDEEGTVVVTPEAKYTKAFNSQEGYASFIERGRMGLIDLTGKQAHTSGTYYALQAIRDGLIIAYCEKNTGPVLIEPNGKVWAFTPEGKYDNIFAFFEGLAAVRSKASKKWGFLNRAGEVVIDFKFDRVTSFSEGVSRVTYKYEGKSDTYFNPVFDLEPTSGPETDISKYTFINQKGFPISPRTVDASVGGFFSGRARFEKDGLFGFLDRALDVVIEPKFLPSPSSFRNGYAVATTAQRGADEDRQIEVSIIDVDAKPSFGPVWIKATDQLSPVIDGGACLRTAGKAGVIDPQGKYLVPAEYDTCKTPVDGTVTLRKGVDNFLFRLPDGKLLWKWQS